MKKIQAFQKHTNLKGAFRYLFKKIFLIVLTIFLGTFITVLIVNRPIPSTFGMSEPQLDSAIQKRIENAVRMYRQDHPEINNLSVADREKILNDYRMQLTEESGINDPFLKKHVKWTLNALRFNWGTIGITNVQPLEFFAQGRTRFNLNEVLLQYLPMTLLLVGASYLLLFVFGLPLALFLSQRTHKWYDRLITWIAPISSVPSWVIGILLIMFFAVELKILPAFGMFGTLPPDTKWGYIPVIAKHMILPVTAIFLSLFFQLVYSWRTIFVTFGKEDYVELGTAMGMKPRRLRRNYILKPTLPFVITNFSLLLISFWQMTMALEIIFQWRGIGWLFINVGLPNFWGESMYPGELIIAVSLIVLFAYLLGITVFLLDFIYVLVDPRIRLVQKEPTLRMIHARRWLFSKKRNTFRDEQASTKWTQFYEQRQKKFNVREVLNGIKQDLQNSFLGINRFAMEFKRFPSALLGLFIIVLLMIGSIYALIALPYREIGAAWGGSTMFGRADVPKLARPAWFNFFTSSKNLSTLILNEQSENTVRDEKKLESGGKQISIVYLLDYYYADFPDEMNLYLTGNFQEKSPFASMQWITPDGREFNLRGLSGGSTRTYNFEENIPARRLVSQNENWQEWFNFTRIFPTPFYYVLFADPNVNTPQVLNGLYQLRISGITFEEASDINTELVMLGQVYGLAGTDYLRRDLSVPLFWGMPFALIIGLFGSLATTILSMVLAATGVWFGGWVDDLIQRLTELNLVLPILMISVLAYAYLRISIWLIFLIVILL
ncbi:MAG: ABC transporter permease subunit, partial [Anaerolineaceae bacterium]|nr:ABC transporter permease subunit [Anaerolineaceae bacterium]